jgi:histidinol-phosphate/aromatic aminotransferase/cobyric acid decarboxylase-like protein
MVGRNFPPYQEEWARISIGTLEQMQQATEAFAKVLRVNATAAA